MGSSQSSPTSAADKGPTPTGFGVRVRAHPASIGASCYSAFPLRSCRAARCAGVAKGGRKRHRPCSRYPHCGSCTDRPGDNRAPAAGFPAGYGVCLAAPGVPRTHPASPSGMWSCEGCPQSPQLVRRMSSRRRSGFRRWRRSRRRTSSKRARCESGSKPCSNESIAHQLSRWVVWRSGR